MTYPEDNSSELTIFEKYDIYKENGNIKDYYIALFHYLNTQYSEDFPSADVRTLITTNEQGKWDTPSGSPTAYKCQGSYIIGLSSSLNKAILDGIIHDSQLIERIENFRSQNFNFHKGLFTSQEEIHIINDLLESVIQNLTENEETIS